MTCLSCDDVWKSWSVATTQIEYDTALSAFRRAVCTTFRQVTRIKLGPDHLRTYHRVLSAQGEEAGSGNGREPCVCAAVLVHTQCLVAYWCPPVPGSLFQDLPCRKLPKILSREEVARLIDASSDPFERAWRMVLYGNGTALP